MDTSLHGHLETPGGCLLLPTKPRLVWVLRRMGSGVWEIPQKLGCLHGGFDPVQEFGDLGIDPWLLPTFQAPAHYPIHIVGAILLTGQRASGVTLAGVFPRLLKVSRTNHAVIDHVVIQSAGVAQSIGDQLDFGIQEVARPLPCFCNTPARDVAFGPRGKGAIRQTYSLHIFGFQSTVTIHWL